MGRTKVCNVTCIRDLAECRETYGGLVHEAPYYLEEVVAVHPASQVRRPPLWRQRMPNPLGALRVKAREPMCPRAMYVY